MHCLHGWLDDSVDFVLRRVVHPITQDRKSWDGAEYPLQYGVLTMSYFKKYSVQRSQGFFILPAEHTLRVIRNTASTVYRILTLDVRMDVVPRRYVLRRDESLSSCNNTSSRIRSTEYWLTA